MLANTEFVSCDPKNPSFDSSQRCFTGIERWVQESFERSVIVRTLQPSRDSISCLLVSIPVFVIRKAPHPKRRVDLHNGGFSARNIPALERPEVNSISAMSTKVEKPRQTGV